MKHLYILFGILFLGLSQSNLSAQTTHYVDQNATGSNNGSSWTNAYVDLQSALTISTAGDSILVAEGVYYPTNTTNRDTSFVLRDSVKLLGGYPGGGGLRDWQTNITVLSGDIGVLNDSTDNTYHVVYTTNLTRYSEINGFTICYGKAVHGSWDSGGGMNNYYSNPTVNNCIFMRNTARYRGGGAENYYSSPKFSGCVFVNNNIRDFLGYGGGLSILDPYQTTDSSIISNCVFYLNSARAGGGFYNHTPYTVVVNCTFYKNFSKINGAGLFSTTSNYVTVINSIFWDNKMDGHNDVANAGLDRHYGTMNVSYCLTQENSDYRYALGSLCNLDPLFVNADSGNFRLQPCSPLINAGFNDTLLNNINADLYQNARIFNNDTVDIGASEYQQLNTSSLSHYNLYVNSASAGGNGLTWATAFNDLQDALHIASYTVNCNAVDTIFVAQGTYYPTTTTDRTLSFEIPNNVVVLAGYNANTGLRDIDSNITYLDGDIGVSNVENDNSLHVVSSNYSNDATTLDGFIIQNGNADSSGVYAMGGGMYNYMSDIVISNCKFYNNLAGEYGGALANHFGCIPTITHCIFENNVVTSSASVKAGAAIYNYYTYYFANINFAKNSLISNCIFKNNSFLDTSSTNNGGGIYNRCMFIKIVDCSFINNKSTRGGGVFNDYSDADLVNNSFANNEAGYGGGVISYYSSVLISNCSFNNNMSSTEGGGIYSGNCNFTRVTNSIFYDNWKDDARNINGSDIFISNTPFSISYSHTQKGSSYSTGTGIINNVNPVFVNPEAGDLRLQACSPLINLGNNDSIPIYVSTDIDGNNRIYNNGTVDMGINEVQQTPTQLSHYNLYVDYLKASNGDGLGWNTAYNDLQIALEQVAKVENCSVADTIFVAEGLYIPTNSFNRDLSFEIPNRAIVLGGYDANTGIRDIDANPTILSGNIGYNSNINDNSYHVIAFKNIYDSTVIDGFIISDGNGTYGAGMYNTNYSSPLISNCIFRDNYGNYGGAMYHKFNCEPIIKNCKFNDNQTSAGSAIYTHESSIILVNCIFCNNSATSTGGTIYNYDSPTPIITNCTFVNNSSNGQGAGIYNYNSNPIIQNTLFWNNGIGINYTTGSGSDIYNYSSSSLRVRNCLLQVNSTYNAGVNNIINQNPLFVDAYNNNFRLQSCSPAIDAGDNDSIPSYILTDFDGNDRIYDNFLVDIGVYEHQDAGNYFTNVFDTICNGGTYMLPDSTIVAAIGTYTSYLSRQNGCDSTIFTDIAFHQKYYSVYDTICDNEIYQLPDNSFVNIQGVYIDTLISSYSCDSIISSYLTVKPTTSSTIYDTICVNDFYITPSGKILNQIGIYYDTISNSRNCDSVIRIDLFVQPISTFSIYDTICANEYYLLSNGNIVNLQGVYSDTLINSLNCDSIVNTYLTVLPNYQIFQYDTICNNDVYTLPNGNLTNVQGAYYDTLTNYQGCDTILVFDLTVNPTFTTYTLDTICEDELYLLPDGSYVNTTGIFVSAISSSSGCDSMVITNLTVLKSIYQVYDTICGNEFYILPDGSTTNIQGVYTSTFIVPNACDSIIKTNLFVINIDTSVTVSIDTLFANQSNAIYQWYDCGNQILIANQNSNMFIPTANGSYAVIIEANNCLDTSNCHAISIIGIAETDFSDKLSIYPNPTDDKISIDLSNKYNDINIKVFSSQGQLLINKEFNDKQIIKLDLSDFPTGVLYISITADNKNGNVKVVKM